MMKWYLLWSVFFVLLLKTHHCFSDTPLPDEARLESLEILTKTQPAEAYRQTQVLYQKTQPDNWQQRHRLVNIMAYQLLILSDLDKADSVLLEWLEVVPENMSHMRTRAMELLGVIAYRRGNMNTARDYLEQALELAETHDDKERIITVNINTAIFLQGLSLFEQSHELLLRADEIAQQEGVSDHLLAVLRNNIAESLIRLERYDEATEYLQDSLDMPEFQADDIAYARRLLVDTLMSKNAFAKAKTYAEQALERYQQRGDLFYQAELHVYLARIARLSKGLNLAEKHINRALDLAEEAQAHQIKTDAYLELSEIKSALYEPAPALAALKQHTTLFKSLHQEQAQMQLIMLREQLDYISHQREISTLEEELKITALNNEYSRRQSLLIIIFLSVISAFLILFFWQQQKKRRQAEDFTGKLHHSYRQLQSAQKQLVESEKMASLGKLVAGVAHELNTPLGIMTTAASVLNESIEQMQTANNSKTLTQKGFARLCGQLQTSDQLIRNNLLRCSKIVQNIKQLAIEPDDRELQSFTLNEAIAATRAELRDELKGITFDCVNTDLRIVCNGHYMQMLLQELCLNSVIHGFNNGSGKLRIVAKVTSNNWQLLYSDNGKGLNENDLGHIFEPFFTTKRGDGQTGLGLNFVYNLVVQAFSGSIEVVKTDTPGLSLKMTFPLAMLSSSSDP
ncbi:tetratricopeptide repeat protein [Lacimicrobium alkaliphilum]|nr:tetratricopeptide repeat protein [Lacimicrobium alkaliphilum]